MNVNVTLVVLTMLKAELQLVLPTGKQELPSVTLKDGNPDQHAESLALGLTGTSNGVQRHGFLSAGEANSDDLVLMYTQLLSEDAFLGHTSDRARAVPVETAGSELNRSQAGIVKRVVDDLNSDLDQVMHSILNKCGLVHLLDLLPDIFDHKELAAAYYALSGKKPPSSRALARMMLDEYAIGSGDKQRVVKGRDLIREYETDEPDLLGQKWDKNKDLYRTGGPKAKRLYKKNTQTDKG
ncbi:hypothetical protein [uncultured Marinobacter sp.]|jgi:hypothetical protein|uniref:hypothetical protein n=1 Tax=uncultured Marinobacter sp. TaxID=187379 RepID=UPI00258EC53B|nr:hypothetical protein [uncultured Marinobacter sp.]